MSGITFHSHKHLPGCTARQDDKVIGHYHIWQDSISAWVHTPPSIENIFAKCSTEQQAQDFIRYISTRTKNLTTIFKEDLVSYVKAKGIYNKVQPLKFSVAAYIRNKQGILAVVHHLACLQNVTDNLQLHSIFQFIADSYMNTATEESAIAKNNAHDITWDALFSLPQSDALLNRLITEAKQEIGE